MLRSGSIGDEVLTLQKGLKAAGYDPGPIDGAFGPKTDAAVRALQEACGIDVDGVVGPQTVAKIYEEQASARSAASGFGVVPAAAEEEEGDGPAPL